MSAIDFINDKNVRVYIAEIPIMGEWADGDEVVTSTNVYKHYKGKWFSVIDLNGWAVVPGKFPML